MEIDGELVSSTRIRKAVETGDFETARRFLGRDYTILGTVQTGAGRGHGMDSRRPTFLHTTNAFHLTASMRCACAWTHDGWMVSPMSVCARR